MIIKRLKLKNYRNYEDLEIELSDKLNIFIGDNAQGKSNILESIVVLALTKSYMNVRDKDLIKDGEEVANISASVMFNGVTDDLFISFSDKVKKLKINNVEIKKYSDYVSKIHFVLFSPGDVNFIKDSPSVRRRNFNVVISQLSNKYVKLLQNYNAILKKRNQFLKTINDLGKCDYFYLDILNEKFCYYAVEIVLERAKFVLKINKNIEKIFEEITGFTGLRLDYISNVDIFDNSTKMREVMLEKLKSNFEREKFYGMTFIGPHRDDYIFMLSDKNMAIYGSQGQNRLAVISLKLSEIGIFKEVTNDYPILLLDDIFSELDIKKKNKLVKYILDDVQTIITTTDLNKIDSALVEKSKIFKIVNGTLVTEEKEG